MDVTPRRSQKRRISRRVQDALVKIRRTAAQSSTTQPGLTSLNETAHSSEESFPANILEESRYSNNINISLDCSYEDSDSDYGGLSDVEEEELPTEFVNTSSSISKRYKLGEWATKYNIKHNALAPLLAMLKDWLPYDNFPKDPRTLLKTPRNLKYSVVEGGEFYHFGISKQISKVIQTCQLSDVPLPNFPHLQNLPNLLTLQIGIDGLPISKSSNR